MTLAGRIGAIAAAGARARRNRFDPLADPDLIFALDARLSARTESGGRIDQINDLSQYGYHPTGTTTTRPAYDATALGGEYPAIRIADSATQFQLLTPSMAAMAGKTGVTIFMVGEIEGSSASRIIFEYGGANGGNTANGVALYDNIGNTNSLSFYTRTNVGSNYWRSNANTEDLSTHKVVTCCVDFTRAGASEVDAIRSMGAALAGAQTGSSNNTAGLNAGTLSIGCSTGGVSPTALKLGALYIVGRVMDDAEKAQWEAHLARAFGLPFPVEMASRTPARILWIGQSNAMSQLESYTEIDKWDGPHTNPRVWAYKDVYFGGVWSTSAWGGLFEDPGNAWEGSDLVTAMRLVRASALAPEIVKCVRGSTTLAVDWASPSGAAWDRLANTTWPTALSSHPSAPASPVPWVVWIQGESDSATSGHATAYEANLTAFLANVRALSGMSAARFVIAKLHPACSLGTTTTIGQIRAAQEAVAAADSIGAYVVETSDLTLHDGLHYSEASAIELGRRIAAVIGANS